MSIKERTDNHPPELTLQETSMSISDLEYKPFIGLQENQASK